MLWFVAAEQACGPEKGLTLARLGLQQELDLPTPSLFAFSGPMANVRMSEVP